ncbi:hypothetical protein EST38_g4539 [Candolleomyces aberdarensis]|uniref:Uncharacterized protein n=1 Tax=Candolleomyces aberdarensis TaxID=2316362 RepID=A0A4Q2DPL8_9AGAR|nr:hypothetical protein EST38_g4539 [Candolleomyces aberdarensis]
MDNSDFPPDNQLSVPDSDRRGRGDSLSSTSTADSANVPQYSTSGSTVGSGTSVAVLTPLIDSNLSLPSTGQVLEEEDRYEETVQDHEIKRQKDQYPLPPPIKVQTPSNYSTLNDRRAHSPLDIDLGLISSHAQAEALVERTRQDILELASGQELSPGTGTSGPTPLSAKLAALGESLYLERKLREQKLGVANKDGAGLPPPLSPLDSQLDILTPVDSVNRNGVERQHSLEAKPRPSAKPRPKNSKRPSTADGLSSRNPSNSFFPDQTRPTHHASLSASPPITSQTSTSFDRREFYTAPHQRSAVFGNGAISNPKLYEPLTAPPLVASRTQKDLDANSLSRVSSAEGVDTETESTVVPLARVPTAGGTTPRKRDPIRNAASTKKLTRMGFTATDQTVARATQPTGKRLGAGFKSIMATLKGK